MIKLRLGAQKKGGGFRKSFIKKSIFHGLKEWVVFWLTVMYKRCVGVENCLSKGRGRRRHLDIFAKEQKETVLLIHAFQWGQYHLTAQKSVQQGWKKISLFLNIWSRNIQTTYHVVIGGKLFDLQRFEKKLTDKLCRLEIPKKLRKRYVMNI